MIWDAWVSFANGTTFAVGDDVKKFILTNDAWMRSNAVKPTENQDYWYQVDCHIIYRY
jgi:hypothetical protein